jgi:hypothetical protein
MKNRVIEIYLRLANVEAYFADGKFLGSPPALHCSVESEFRQKKAMYLP